MDERVNEERNGKRVLEDVKVEEEDEQRRKKLKQEDGTGTDVAAGIVDEIVCQIVSNESVQDETTRKVDVERKEEGEGKQNGSVEMGGLKARINYKNKKKCVLLLSYCGDGYHGMQRNPGVPTIEEDLTNALLKANAISEDASRNYGKMSFQRCARTDKGVSAARQVVSLKHMVASKELLPEINQHLKPQIRIFDGNNVLKHLPIKKHLISLALKKVTRGFDCKKKCTSRTYEYLMPTFAFAQSYARTASNFRITEEIRERINEILGMYKGTHNFHNFTSGRGFKDESSKRYMMQLEIAGEPFVENNTEFIVLQIQGQSFMQHQIRKMIGLLIAIIRNCTRKDSIQRSFEQSKMDIPKAPGLGLILDQVHFKDYNEKFGNDSLHEPLTWAECEDKIAEFKRNFIYNKIIESEIKTKSMSRWLGSLSCHSYSSTGMGVPISAGKQPADEGCVSGALSNEGGKASEECELEPSVVERKQHAAEKNEDVQNMEKEEEDNKMGDKEGKVNVTEQDTTGKNEGVHGQSVENKEEDGQIEDKEAKLDGIKQEET